MNDILTYYCEKVIRLEESGKKISKLHTVDPDMVTYPAIINSAISSLKIGEVHYSSSKGLKELRLVLAERYKTSPDSLIIGSGSRSLMYGLLENIVHKKDEVIIPEPEWANFFVPLIENKGGKVIRVPRNKDDWNIDLECLRKSMGPKTKLLVLSNPNNPTGAILSESILDEIQKMCFANRTYFVYDAAYEPLSYHKRNLPLDLSNPYFIYVGSFSKGFSMPGFRVGFLHCQNEEIVNKLVEFNYNTVQCLPTFTQKAAITALKNEEKILMAATKEYLNRLSSAIKILDKNHVMYSLPSAAPFLYLQVGKNQAEKIASRLLKEHIAVCPSTAFGKHNDYIRITLVSKSELLPSLEKISKQI